MAIRPLTNSSVPPRFSYWLTRRILSKQHPYGLRFVTSPSARRTHTHFFQLQRMVVNILGKSFSGNTVVQIGLASKFFGVGAKTSERICSKLGIYPQMRMVQLDEPRILDITKELSDLKIENDLKTEIRNNIRIKRETLSYEGRRHIVGLPVRGQRTRTNALTAKKLNRVNRHL